MQMTLQNSMYLILDLFYQELTTCILYIQWQAWQIDASVIHFLIPTEVMESADKIEEYCVDL